MCEIILTDTRGRWVALDDTEPEHGSVVLANGPRGTAWQRFEDGLWHTAGYGKARSWEWLSKRRNLVLVHEAAPSGRSEAVEDQRTLAPLPDLTPLPRGTF